MAGAVLMLLCALDLIGGLFPALSPLPVIAAAIQCLYGLTLLAGMLFLF